MATADEYAQWIVANEGKKGTSDFDVVAQAYRLAKEEESGKTSVADIPTGIAGITAEKFSEAQVLPETTIGEDIVGAGEAALTLATGATGGTLGLVGGTLKGLAEQILSGEFGTREAADLVEQSAIEGARALTFEPRTRAGREIVGDIGEVLQAVPPVIPALAEAGTLTRGAAAAVPAVTAATTRGAGLAQQAGKRAVEAGRGLIEPKAEVPATSIGAAKTPEALRRRTVAESMPVPFKGESALTEGQETRDYEQLQFEKETAKLGNIGAPLRERAENHAATFIQNFDAMVDRLEPFAVETRKIGRIVDQAVVNKAEVQRKRIMEAYKKAEEAGEMQAPVEMDRLPGVFDKLVRFEGVAKNIIPIKDEALRIGAITQDAEGNILPSAVSLNDSELLRQFVNESTDWMDRRQSLMARRIKNAIDSSTEQSGGDLYRAARKLRTKFANEFKNTGITSKLLGTKRGTDERSIALDDVFDEIFLSSSIEEMNKLRSTLLTAGKQGKQAWTDIKAAGINYIKESSLSPSQQDAAGNPLLSPDKLNKVVRRLDEAGKLESLYGKTQAQQLRDLAELSTVIYTAPPGAVNFSNTASALQVALDSVATFGITGIPVPVATTLREASRYLKNRKIKQRIDKALGVK